jgi:YD repeat-containing protein
MRNIATKYLAWILAAWIGSVCMTLSTAGVAAERQPVGLTSLEYDASDLVTSATMPDRRGNGDDSIILDDPDAVDSDAAAPTGVEDLQPFGLASDVPHQRVAVYGRVRPRYTAFFVEPRFLRYSRLLN